MLYYNTPCNIAVFACYITHSTPSDKLSCI